ncbi:hypothetical protein [Enterobacter hormaechei]|uniref:hypothetical protein n=1 Tax=Enterobacter hormaechei TaxID=158836 RepID=UPI002A758870|nr:hypothetical protein [Enterobacter hormaechei]MDY3570233.1 hypothetical protein [Enterobacter hormaechei]
MFDLISYLTSNNINHYILDNGEIAVAGSLNLYRNKDITALPEGLSVGGGLDLEGTQITALPEGLSVGGWLDLEGTQITALPEGLSVGGGLDLEGTQITALPEGLSVGGWLNLRGTQITALPDHFTCKRLYLDPGRISNATYRTNCGYSSRTIFAVWNGVEFRIAAGCFYGTIADFEDAVDDSYSGDAAETYKQAARDCIAELTTKLNPVA